jgi:hypothetical protein
LSCNSFFTAEHGDGTTDFEIETDELVASTMKDVAKGEPITINFGGRSNKQLLLYSGFVMAEAADHPHDRVHLQFRLDATDAMYKIKAVRKRLVLFV